VTSDPAYKTEADLLWLQAIGPEMTFILRMGRPRLP
jgi:hypothetical protein